MSRRQPESQNVKEELAVLEFLQAGGGLCTTWAFEDYVKQCPSGNLKGRVEDLVSRGLVLQPGPGQLYILSERGHRRYQTLRKLAAQTRPDMADPHTPSQ